MTAVDPQTPVCPECGGQNTMVLSDGNGRCFDDGHEWDPTTVVSIPRAQRPARAVSDTVDVTDPPGGAETTVPATEATSDVDVAGMAETYDPESYRDMLDGLVGGIATLEGGQTGVIVAFTPDNDMVIRLPDDRVETVHMSDVERVAEPEPDVSAGVDPLPPSGIVIAPADAYLMSNLLLELGVASILDGPDGAEVGPPPVGIHDYSAEALELVNAGAVVAIERLIIAYDIDVEDLLAGLIERPAIDSTVTTTTEGNDDASTSNDG